METSKMKHEGSGEIKATILSLVDMVEYQDGSVVSREIVSGKKGSITLFAFDKGQGLSEHSAPFDATVYVIDGDASIMISGEEYNLKTGEMIIMPSNEPHALTANQRFKMLLIMIRD